MHRFKVLIPLVLYALLTQLSHATDTLVVVKPGSDILDSHRLKGFSAKWLQFSIEKGERSQKASAEYQETLEWLGKDQLKHQQIITSPRGVVTNTTIFDAATLSPISITQVFSGMPAGAPKQRQYRFADNQIHTTTLAADGSSTVQTTVMPTAMFNVSNLGLVLAALPIEKGKVYRLPAVFPQFQHSQYWMDVTVAGERRFVDATGESQLAWQLDVRWINIKEGDEYPGGVSASGGAYFIAQEATDNFPPVPAYINDTMAIEIP